MLFGLVGLLNTLVDFGAFLILVKFGVMPLVANILSFTLGAINSFILNGRITFKIKLAGTGHGKVFIRGLRFAFMTGLNLLISQAVLAAGLAIGWSPTLAKIAATIFTFVVGFTLSKLYVFRMERP